jgi:glycosyltransferase involved in cell wall biosynthesis
MWDPATRTHEVGGAIGRAALGAFAASQRGLDRRSARRPDSIVVNSRNVARRVRAWWGREATVVHPPVDTDWYAPDPDVAREDFFLLAGRLVPYKRPEIAVEAARRAGVRLLVAGDGRARGAVERSSGPGIELLGRIDDGELRDLYRRCRALVFPGEEDFGLVPVEAQACGAPVIAASIGGAVETVVDGVTGILYAAHPDPVATLADEMARFDDSSFDTATIRRHALGFEPRRFRDGVAAAVAAVLDGRARLSHMGGPRP